MYSLKISSAYTKAHNILQKNGQGNLSIDSFFLHRTAHHTKCVGLDDTLAEQEHALLLIRLVKQREAMG